MFWLETVLLVLLQTGHITASGVALGDSPIISVQFLLVLMVHDTAVADALMYI